MKQNILKIIYHMMPDKIKINMVRKIYYPMIIFNPDCLLSIMITQDSKLLINQCINHILKHTNIPSIISIKRKIKNIRNIILSVNNKKIKENLLIINY